MEKNSFQAVRLDTKIERNYFEKLGKEHGLAICGIDEVGRGPLAGPVVAAAAIIKPIRRVHALLRDSKILTQIQREFAYEWLMKNAWYGVGVVNHRLIDEIGISLANKMAMRRAFAQLSQVCPIQPAIILIDAVPLFLPEARPQPLPNHLIGLPESSAKANPWHKIIHFPHSEEKSHTIAAASIIAKVTRDRLMRSLAMPFPGYGFDEHKGYGTPDHRQSIKNQGRALIHRGSFLRNMGEEPQPDQEAILPIWSVAEEPQDRV